ncbi:hypothetical protein Tco_1102761 [Tanacetum coccineum]
MQQASTSGTQSDNTPVYDSDGSTEIPKDENCYDHDIFNMLTHEVQYTDLQTELDRTKEKLENCIIKKEKEYDIERLQARLGDLKGKSSDTQCASNTLDLLSQKQEDENVSLEFQVSKTKGTTKVDKTNALSKPVTSNSASSTRELKVMQTVNVIAPRIFRTNHSKTSRVDNVVHNKPIKISVRIKPITVSQPNVIHKQHANSDLNGFSSTSVNNTAKTIRPYPRSNSNTDKVSSKSKSGCLPNNVKKIEENNRNSQIPKNQKHMSSECNNIMLAIRNAKSEIICVMCKQCLVTTNHDICVLNYVNDMNSHADNQSANVSKRENQKKHKANAKKSKELGASTSNPSEPSSKGFLNSTSLLGSWKVYSVICLTNYSNGENQVVSKSSAVTTADASDKHHQQQDSTSSTSTLATAITADGIFDL